MEHSPCVRHQTKRLACLTLWYPQYPTNKSYHICHPEKRISHLSNVTEVVNSRVWPQTEVCVTLKLLPRAHYKKLPPWKQSHFGRWEDSTQESGSREISYYLSRPTESIHTWVPFLPLAMPPSPAQPLSGLYTASSTPCPPRAHHVLSRLSVGHLSSQTSHPHPKPTFLCLPCP